MSKHEGQHESGGFVSEREAREHLATLAGAAGRVAAAGWSGTWMAVACLLGGVILGALAMRREGTHPGSPLLLHQQPQVPAMESRAGHVHSSGTASPPACSAAALQTASAAVEELRGALIEARARAQLAEASLRAAYEAGALERQSALAAQQILEQQLAAERVARLHTELTLRGALVRGAMEGSPWARMAPWPTPQGVALRPIPGSPEAAPEESLEP